MFSCGFQNRRGPLVFAVPRKRSSAPVREGQLRLREPVIEHYGPAPFETSGELLCPCGISRADLAQEWFGDRGQALGFSQFIGRRKRGVRVYPAEHIRCVVYADVPPC